MANGTATQDKKLQFRPRTSSPELKPDAPEGGWDALIPRGKCKVTVTQKGDPRLIIPFQLEKAHEEKNEKFQKSEVQFTAIVFDDEDPERRRGANMMKGRLRALCEACEVDFAEVYPTTIESAEDFDKLFSAIEGKKLPIWTVHTKREVESGEMVTDTEIRFRKPGSGLVTKEVDGDDEERPGKHKARKSARR